MNALDDVRSMAASGDYLLAFDHLEKLRASSADTPELQHLAVLCLARSGATQNAMRLFKKLALDKLDTVEISNRLKTDIEALWARLLKDQALAANSNREQKFAEAASEYEKIYRENGGYYPAINAAALWLLAGDRERSKDLARATNGSWLRKPNTAIIGLLQPAPSVNCSWAIWTRWSPALSEPGNWREGTSRRSARLASKCLFCAPHSMSIPGFCVNFCALHHQLRRTSDRPPVCSREGRICGIGHRARTG